MNAHKISGNGLRNAPGTPPHIGTPLTEPSILTRSGQAFYYERPDDFDYSLADIGYALGNLCRYAGQNGWWSVAQHSLLVAWLAEPRDKLRALLHDASEAFLVDVPGPLKRMDCMVGYRELEAQVMRAIHREFGILEDAEAEKRVKRADILAYEMESKYLGRGNGYAELSLVIPEEIRRMNRAEAQDEFERMAEWLLEQ